MKPFFKTIFKILTVKFAVLAVAAFTVSLLFGQQQLPSVTNSSGSWLPEIPRDPWFWLFVGYAVFSSATTSMPEPKQTSSDFYIWIYRWFHLLSQAGTSYFQNKMFWPGSNANGNTPPPSPETKK